MLYYPNAVCKHLSAATTGNSLSPQRRFPAAVGTSKNRTKLCACLKALADRTVCVCVCAFEVERDD